MSLESKTVERSLAIALLCGWLAPATASAAAPTSTNGAVEIIDFCSPATKPTAAGKLVMFALGGEDLATAPEAEVNERGEVIGRHEALRSVTAYDIARTAVYHRFPMRRHHTVGTQLVAAPGLYQAKNVSVADLQAAAQGDPFAAYSIGCADWVALPRLTGRPAQWMRVPREKIVNGVKIRYLAWQLDLDWQVSLTVFKRTSQETFSLAGTARARSASIEARQGSVLARPSARPVEACFATTPTPANVSTCPIDHRVPPEVGADCLLTDDNVSNPEALVTVARCVATREAREMTTALQVEAVSAISEWKLRSALQSAPRYGTGEFGMALGTDEGVERGNTYEFIRDDNGQETPGGWGKITAVGPGGSEGSSAPSWLRVRSGRPTVGTRVRELPMHGATLAAGPASLALYDSGAASRMGVGGSLSLGYDVTKWIPFGDESWLRGDITLCVGKDTDIVAFGLLHELHYYAGERWSHIYGLGLDVLGVSVAVPGVGPDGAHASGSTAGLLGLAALEYAFTPRVTVRAALRVHQHFSKVVLKLEGVPVREAGTASGAELALTTEYTF